MIRPWPQRWWCSASCIEGLAHKLIMHASTDAATEPYVEEMVVLITAYLAAR